MGSNAADAISAQRRARRENLAALFQEVLTAVVRLRANPASITDPATFRQQFRAALASASDSAVRSGYTPDDARLATFAAVAFLDESILNSGSPQLLEWARRPLQEEMFGVHVAGEMFFSYLEELLRRGDSMELADLLEVYGLCLRLGFRGKLSAGGAGDLRALTERTVDRVQRIRGMNPVAAFDPGSEIPRVMADPWQRKLMVLAGATAVLAIVLFAAYSFLLRSGAADVARVAEGITL